MLKFKKSICSLLVTFLVALLLIACQNSDDSENGGNNEPPVSEKPVTAGWYLYTTNANSVNIQNTYFYINSSGTIERAGSQTNEYTVTELENLQKSLNYSTCKKNADMSGSTITFSEAAAPSWADKTAEPGDDTGTGKDPSGEENGNESEDNPGTEPDDDTKEDNTESNNPASLIVGKWYCPDGVLSSYLEFYAAGTGKAYMSSPNNYSSFNWNISENGSRVTFSGNLRDSSEFTVTTTTLWLNSLCGLNNLTYTRQ